MECDLAGRTMNIVNPAGETCIYIQKRRAPDTVHVGHRCLRSQHVQSADMHALRLDYACCTRLPAWQPFGLLSDTATWSSASTNAGEKDSCHGDFHMYGDGTRPHLMLSSDLAPLTRRCQDHCPTAA